MNVLNQPLSLKEMVQMMNEKEMIEAIVPIELSKLISYDFESLLDEMSELATGSILLCDITYEVAPHHVNPETVAMKVTGDATNIIDHLVESLHDDLDGRFDFADGYTPEEAIEMTTFLTESISDCLKMPIRFVMEWHGSDSELLMINSEGTTHEVTIPYIYFDSEEGEVDPLDQFINDVLDLM